MAPIRADRIRLELVRARRPALIVTGLIVAAVIAGAAMLSRQIFVSPFGDYYRVEVPVSSAKGVLAGKTEVTIAGVEVGLVDRVRLVGGQPVITLAIQPEDGPLYADATAHVGAWTPFQDMYVDLDRGSPGSGRIPDGGSLRLGRATVGVDPGDVLATFDADTRSRLATLLDELGRGLPDGGVRLRQSFAELVPFMETARAVTRQVAAQRAAVERIVHNFGGLTGALAKRDRQLTRLVTAGSGTLSELGRNDRPLAATIAELPQTMRGLRTSFAELGRAEGEIDPAVRSLRPAARQLGPGIGALRHLSVRAVPALRALRPAAAELRPFSSSLASSSSALRSAFTELRPLTPELEDTVRDVVPCLPALGHLLRNFTSANAYGDAKGSFWRTQLTVGPDTVGGLAHALQPIPYCAEGGR
jgi:ABC-type transporter Mla subunit MlaD